MRGLPKGYSVVVDGDTKVLYAADNVMRPLGKGDEWIEGDERRMVARWSPGTLTEEQISTIARLDLNSRRTHTNHALQSAARKMLARFFVDLGARARNGRLLRSVEYQHDTAK